MITRETLLAWLLLIPLLCFTQVKMLLERGDRRGSKAKSKSKAAPKSRPPDKAPIGEGPLFHVTTKVTSWYFCWYVFFWKMRTFLLKTWTWHSGEKIPGRACSFQQPLEKLKNSELITFSSSESPVFKRYCHASG